MVEPSDFEAHILDFQIPVAVLGSKDIYYSALLKTGENIQFSVYPPIADKFLAV